MRDRFPKTPYSEWTPEEQREYQREESIKTWVGTTGVLVVLGLVLSNHGSLALLLIIGLVWFNYAGPYS